MLNFLFYIRIFVFIFYAYEYYTINLYTNNFIYNMYYQFLCQFKNKVTYS